MKCGCASGANKPSFCCEMTFCVSSFEAVDVSVLQLTVAVYIVQVSYHNDNMYCVKNAMKVVASVNIHCRLLFSGTSSLQKARQ